MKAIQFICPECGAALDLTVDDQEVRTCSRCQSDWQFHRVSMAETVASLTERLPRSRSDSETATCYNHPDNLAQSGCDSCGRFVCAVCSIPFEGKNICPSCRDGERSMEWPTLRPQTRRFAFPAAVIGAWALIFIVVALVELVANRVLPIDHAERVNNIFLSMYFAVIGVCFALIGGLLVFLHFMSQLAVYEDRKSVPIFSILCIVMTLGFTFIWGIFLAPEFIQTMSH